MALTFKKGDSVILCGFTGMKLGVYEVKAATKSEITIEKADGSELIFSRKTGKQVNVAEGKEKYANFIIEDDGSYENPLDKARKSKKSTKKAASKKAKKEVEPDEEYEEEDEEDEAPKKKVAKKSAKKTASKKKPVEPEEDEEDDEYEEE